MHHSVLCSCRWHAWCALFCVQACGAAYGVAPFISRRAYGVVGGTIGAGGNVGSIVTLMLFFSGSKGSPTLTTQKGLVWMGVMIVSHRDFNSHQLGLDVAMAAALHRATGTVEVTSTHLTIQEDANALCAADGCLMPYRHPPLAHVGIYVLQRE